MSTRPSATHPHILLQADRNYKRKHLFLQKKKRFSAGLPYGGFSSVAGRGNLTKEAPAKVTTRIFNDVTENLLISM